MGVTTLVRIPPLAGGTATIRLVYLDEPTQQVLGFEGPEWATAYERLDLAEAVQVPLTPTALIAMPDGRATCYRVAISTSGGRDWAYCIQVPNSGEAQELATLVGAATIPPAALYPASAVTVAFTPTNYTPASATVEAHLQAINAALAP